MSSDTQPLDRLLLDVIAAMTELIAAGDDTEAAQRAIANTLMDELTHHDPEHLVAVFAGILNLFVNQLADSLGITPTDLWSGYALDVSTQISKENDHE